MNFSRRHFLGASFAASAGIIASSALPGTALAAVPKLADRPELLPRAMAALDAHGGRIAHRDMIAIADFSAASKEMRFHFVDVAAGRIKASYLVAHGKGSDPINSGFVQRFSNRPGSNASCEGSFLTGETYYGKHGRSRQLHGLDAENNKAFERAIVIHGADYVDKGLARSQGRIGRSLGCFAVERSEIAEVLSRLGSGHLLFAAR